MVTAGDDVGTAINQDVENFTGRTEPGPGRGAGHGGVLRIDDHPVDFVLLPQLGELRPQPLGSFGADDIAHGHHTHRLHGWNRRQRLELYSVLNMNDG